MVFPHRRNKLSASAGINFISGGLKKSAEDHAKEVKSSAETAGDDVDPLLQEQFGQPSRKPARQRRAYKAVDKTASQGWVKWQVSFSSIQFKRRMYIQACPLDVRPLYISTHCPHHSCLVAYNRGAVFFMLTTHFLPAWSNGHTLQDTNCNGTLNYHCSCILVLSLSECTSCYSDENSGTHRVTVFQVESRSGSERMGQVGSLQI